MRAIIINDKSITKDIFKEKYFSDSFVHKINNRKFHVVKSLSNEMFVIAFCDLQEWDISSCLTHLITNFNITSIISIGFAIDCCHDCGFDIFLMSEVFCKSNFFDYSKNISTSSFYKIKTNDHLNEMITKIVSLLPIHYTYGCSSYYYFKNDSLLLNNFNKNIAIVYDYDSMLIAQICYYYNVAFSIIRINNNLQDHLLKETIVDQLIYNIIQEISFRDTWKDKDE